MNKIAIIGVGLIGGSLGLDLRSTGWAKVIVGFGRGHKNLEKALEIGAIDRFESTIDAACENAELVVISASLGATPAILEALRTCVDNQTIITDVGSVKGSVVRDARRILGNKFSRFVPGHPIAGNEKSGADAAIPGLFRDHKVILTPTSGTDSEAVNKVQAMWNEVGADVVKMEIETHDRALAMTSHLPHLLAYSAVDTMLNQDDAETLLDFSAGGFRDFTRVASSNPELWADILLLNRENILNFCVEYKNSLDTLMLALEAGDREIIVEVFSRSKKARDARFVAEKKK